MARLTKIENIILTIVIDKTFQKYYRISRELMLRILCFAHIHFTNF